MALIGMISEALSLLSLELILFCFAALVYAVVTGKVPGVANASKSKKICEPEEAEEESAAKELQARLAAGDHRAAFRVWQRVKSLDGAPSVPVNLAGVVRAMRALGKKEEEIVNELRSGFECNEALGQSAGSLLEALRREGDTSLSLVAAVIAMLEGQGIAVADAAYESLMAGHLRRRNFGEVKAVADRRKGAITPRMRTMLEALSAESAADVEKQVTAIKACGLDRNLQGAKRVFDNLKKSGAPMNPLIYNCLIDSCIQCGDAKAALEYFEQMKQLDFVDVVSYNTVLKAHLSLRHFDEARALLREMAARGLPANQVTYNEFLRALIAVRDRRAVWSLVDDMEASKVAPDAAMCSILLKSLTEHSHSSDIGRTMALLHQMRDPIDEVVFSSAAEACIRAGRLDQLSALMQQLEEQGVSLALTAPCYGSMIKAFGRGGDVDRVWQLWREMGKRGVRPTSITVGCTVDALVKNGSVEDAWALVQELSLDDERRQYVNTVIFSTVLKGFAAARQPKRVFAVHSEMRKAGVACNTITYNTIIDACARCSCMDKVPALLEEMKQGHAEPDVITYSTLVKGYCFAGDVDRAFKVLAEMKADGKYAPDEILYNSLLDGCAKQSRVEDAVKLLGDMRAIGLMPSNFTLSIMVKLLGRARRLQEAFALVDELCKENGLHPNIQVYTCLVQACVQNRKVNQALDLHETMITEAGCVPDEKFYSALARGCLQVGSPEKAALVVRCAHHLPGHTMATSRGSPKGVEFKVVEETLAKLQAGGAKGREVAAELASDLQASGVSERRSPQGGRGPGPQRVVRARA